MNWKQGIRATAFLLIFVVLFVNISRILTLSSDDHEYHGMAAIYEEEEKILDAVYIGSSNTYAFWNPMVAWGKYGIAVHTYTCSSQPFMIAEYLLKEARKTQPDAVYLFNINTIGDRGLGGVKADDVVMHRVLDSMPLSLNKLQLTDYMCDILDLSFSDRLEYYLPIVKYHSRWDEINESHFSVKPNNFKGANFYNYSFYTIENISSIYNLTDNKRDIKQDLLTSLNSLLDYCDENSVKAVFVTAPRAEEIQNIEKINTVNEIIKSRGYPTINILENYKDLNLDLTQDYYNNNHTNIHGSIKYTQYISEYLIENYGFKDKRNDARFSKWNEGYKEYEKLMKPYVLDFEFDSVHRNFELQTPNNIKVVNTDSAISVTWNKSEKADGYVVFRKHGMGSAWREMGTSYNTSFNDTNIKQDKNYYYTVVPFTVKDGERYYGNYLYKGIYIRS